VLKEMELIIIENVEFTKAIDELNSLLNSSQNEKYKIIPKNIEYNFGEVEVWYGAIAALYTVIQIIDLGSKKVNEMVKKRELKYKKKQEEMEVKDVKEHNNEYKITVEDKEVQITVTKNEKSYTFNIKNVKDIAR
jgi:galactitol-specific phosphotransferase system IIB component